MTHTIDTERQIFQVFSQNEIGSQQASMLLGIPLRRYEGFAESDQIAERRLRVLARLVHSTAQRAPKALKRFGDIEISPNAFFNELRELRPQLSQGDFASLFGRARESAHRWLNAIGGEKKIMSRRFLVVRMVLQGIPEQQQSAILAEMLHEAAGSEQNEVAQLIAELGEESAASKLGVTLDTLHLLARRRALGKRILSKIARIKLNRGV